MPEQIICPRVIIKILSGNCILQCFYGSRNHCLFQTDLFASRLNFETKSYVSWFPDPDALAVDAF